MCLYGGVMMPVKARDTISCWFSERTVAGDLREMRAGRCSPKVLLDLCNLCALSTPYEPVYEAIRLYVEAVEAAALARSAP
jgi:hypothetical protein